MWVAPSLRLGRHIPQPLGFQFYVDTSLQRLTYIYSLLFNSKNFLFSSVLPFLLHACMYSYQVYNSNVDLASKIGLSTWTKLDGYSYSYLPCYYAKVSPLHMYCEVCCQVNCLQTCEHISAYWAIKVYVSVKFHIQGV